MSEKNSKAMQKSAPCMWMRGGTSKGGYFLKSDLPMDDIQRNEFLMAIMGSPDPRQIDGMGGADPLTSKIAIISKSSRPGVDVDYLFLQVSVDQPLVSAAQNCGNLLAGVAPFAVERGLVEIGDETTCVSIYMENTGQIANARINTIAGKVNYHGAVSIDGVPGTSAAVELEFQDIAGSSCGALLPTGNSIDIINNIEVTLIDNGMPCVILRAVDFDISGTESREELDAHQPLKDKLEAIRLLAGTMMNLGDVTDKTIPKMTLISLPLSGGTISTRTFIPHRCHASIGVLGAVSVATACIIKGSVANQIAHVSTGNTHRLEIEHPIGKTQIIVRTDDNSTVTSSAILRTARKLFDGIVYS